MSPSVIFHLDFIGLKCVFQVVVSTKSPKTDKQYVWEAVADSSSYVIKEETDPEKLITRGTQITLFLRVSSPDCYKVDNILWQISYLLSTYAAWW